jgi:RNase P subunit RPR2
MTITDILQKLDAFTDRERLAFLESWQSRFCSDCGGLLIECGCYRCATCGHHDKLSCECAAKRREQARERARKRAENAQAFAAMVHEYQV